MTTLLPIAAVLAALASQVPSAPPGAPAPPGGRAADAASAESIVAALYDVISGPAGQPRDWARMRALFAPGARLIPVSRNPEGRFAPRALDVEGYVSRTTPIFEKSGFFEREIARREERFGHVVHVLSTYESRHAPGEAPFARGVNSVQLVNDGSRWWIVTVLWEAETPEAPIPERFLPAR